MTPWPSTGSAHGPAEARRGRDATDARPQAPARNRADAQRAPGGGAPAAPGGGRARAGAEPGRLRRSPWLRRWRWHWVWPPTQLIDGGARGAGTARRPGGPARHRTASFVGVAAHPAGPPRSRYLGQSARAQAAGGRGRGDGHPRRARRSASQAALTRAHRPRLQLRLREARGSWRSSPVQDTGSTRWCPEVRSELAAELGTLRLELGDVAGAEEELRRCHELLVGAQIEPSIAVTTCLVGSARIRAEGRAPRRGGAAAGAACRILGAPQPRRAGTGRGSLLAGARRARPGEGGCGRARRPARDLVAPPVEPAVPPAAPVSVTAENPAGAGKGDAPSTRPPSGENPGALPPPTRRSPARCPHRHSPDGP